MNTPILSLKNIRLSFGGNPLFTDLSFYLKKQDKFCLVGRNGCGKSTLLKVLAGIIEEDAGQKFMQPGVELSYLPQEMTLPPNKTIIEFITENKAEPFEALAILDHLQLNPHLNMETLSGGERRRVALARTLAVRSDILLLDEPTNHLDLPTIQWLENYLREFNGGLVVISHDRTFLETVSNATAWLDQGQLRSHNMGFKDFDNWADQILEEEEKQQHRLNNRLKLETAWLHRGVTARRKRNQGRLRNLINLRQQKQEAMGQNIGKAKITSLEGDWGSKLVIEAKDISKALDNRILINNFNARILRGERIGILGPNGAGKTTLLKILLKLLPPDQGSVRLGKTVQPIYFDQMRRLLKPELTLLETLCPQGGDQVWVQGKPRHVFGYLKDFLFNEKQISGVVGILSGGEQNRLSLAKALAQPGNLLVLDEPTNDLDMDTLDLLIDVLSQFEGTLIMVSHDRDFLDKLTTSLIVMEGDGTVSEYVGGYQDYLRQRPVKRLNNTAVTTNHKTNNKNFQSTADLNTITVAGGKIPPKRLSYNQKREWEGLPKLIEDLSKLINQLEGQLASPALYDQPHNRVLELSQTLEQKRQELDKLETRWLELEELVAKLT